MTDYLRLAQERAPQAAEEQDNPYMSLAQEQQNLQQNRARTVLESALKDDPDLAAERLRVSKTSGVPLRVVERNLDELRVKERARAIDLVSMAQDSPVLYRQITDPTFATTSVDDLDTLKNLERSVGKGVRYVMGADGKGGLPSDLVDATKTVGLGATVGIGKMAFDAAGVVNDLIGWDKGATDARGTAKQLQSVMDRYGFQPESSTGQAVRSGLQSAGTNLALLPIGLYRGLYATANQAASTVAGVMAAGVGASAYNEARDQGRNSLQAGVYAIPQATFEYVFERIPAAKLFGDIAANTGLLKTIGRQTLSEGWTEQVTTLAQDFNEWMNLNPDKTLAQFINERPEAAYQTFIATMVGVGVQTSTIKGINKIIEKATDTSVKFDQDLLESQMQLAAQSMLRQRSPEQFRTHVQRVVDENDGAKKEIYVDGEVLNQLPQELLAQLPESVREQIPGALETNSTVAIPMADVLTVAPGTELEQILNDNARMRPNAASRVEAELTNQYLQQEAQRVLQQAQDQSAWQQSSEAVKQTVLDQLNSTGRFTPDVNEAYASLQANFFSTMAARVGITPQELYDRYSLKVAAKQVGQGGVLNFTDPVTFRTVQAGDTVDGRVVREAVPNLSSIGASLDNYTVLEGVREIPLTTFDPEYLNSITMDRLDERTRNLADEIKASGEIAPLIVAFDSKGAYIIEGGHRFDALIASGAQSIPAVVVIDQNDQPAQEYNQGAVIGEGEVKRVLRREPGNFTEDEQAAYDAFMESRPDAERIKANLERHQGTPWAKQAVEGIFTRQAMRMLIEGQTPTFQSSMDSGQVKRTREVLQKRGLNGLWGLLEADGGLMGAAAKPVNNVNSSFINCDPSVDCAKYCYATKGNYQYANVIVKSELVTLAVELDPVRAAQRVAAEYKATAEFANNKALRLFDKGDGNELWLPFISELNKQGVRVQIFSKVPTFLRQVPDMNLKLLSIDDSNMEMADANPDLPVAFVYTGKSQIDMLAKLAARNQVQVVLPVKLGQKLLDGTEITDLKKAVPEVKPYLCPIDSGFKKLGKTSQHGTWNCTKCDVNGGVGCFHGTATKAVMESYEAKPATQQERAQRILELRSQINAITANTAADVAQAGQLPPGGVEGLLREVDTLLGELLRDYDTAPKTGATVEIGRGADAASAGPAGSVRGRRVIPIRPVAGAPTRSGTDPKTGGVLNQDGPRLAPNGKPSNLTPELHALVRTAEFKTWFGDWEKHATAENPVGSLWSDNEVSKAVDENGEPLVVYHGTDAGGFTEFNTPGGKVRGDLGIFLTPNRAMAASYVKRGRARDIAREQTGEGADRVSGVYPLFVNIRDPYDTDFEGALWNGERPGQYVVLNEDGEQLSTDDGTMYFELFDDANTFALENGGTVEPAPDHWETTDGAVREARSNGNDGTVIRNVVDEGGGDSSYAGEPSDVFVAFDPTQIKSVENFGTFDANNPDIYQQGPRGTFSPEQLLVTLNENADLSTFLHESGHFFLEVMADLASQPNAPQQIQDDMAATLKWFGVPDLATWNSYTLDEKRPYHEKWAESFEQYLFEGKAPSEELQPLFRRFRSWLVNVYKSLTQFMRARNLKLNDEVRQVFDRMIATDEQIAQAEEAAGMLPDFEATNEAIEQLQARSLRDLKWTVKARGKALKALEKQTKELRKGVEAEVRAEVEKQPLYAAMNWLRKGEMTNEAGEQVKAEKGFRLNTQALAEMYPESMLARPDLTRLKGMTVKDGLHPDLVADMFGFESGDQLVRAVIDAEPIASVIEGMTDQRMLERHGDLATPEAREAAANEAVHNEARARSLATELKSQAEMLNPRQDTGRTATNGRAITVNAITAASKQFAENLAARRRIKDLKSATWQHRSAEARAGKRWQEATAKGKTEEAVQAKRDQVLNNATVKALQDAQAEVKKIVEFFKRVTKGTDEKIVERGRDPDVVNAMRAILGAYDVAPRLEKSALAYMEAVSRNDPAMYAALKPSVDTAMLNAKPLIEMTMEELRGLTDELRAMWALAKRSRQMEVDGNLMDIEDAADELVIRMGEIGIPDTIPGETGAITDKQERGIKLQFAKAILSRVEQWSERLDGKFGGPFLRLVFQPVKDAADRYRTDKVAYRKKFTELLQAVAPSLPQGPIAAPELNYTFGNARDSGAAELLHAILHTGNDSNKRKLLLGRGWATQNADGTIDTSKWDTFIQRMQAEGKLTKAHYDFAQGVWDLLEEMKPLAQETHRKVFGRYFAEVTANEFTTPFGTYRGGYVPAQTDSRLVKDAKLRELAEGENESMAYAFPAAPSGFTKSRVEYNQPLLLDLRALGQHMDKVLLFSHMQGAVTDVRRLLTNKRVSYALDRIDPAAYEGMLIPWLNRSARQVVETPVVGDRGLARMLGKLRGRAGMALMVANLSNTVQQITGFSSAAVKVKPGLLLSATARFAADPKGMKTSVAEASPYMKDRMLNEVGAMNDAVEEILIDPTLLEKSQAWTQRHAYFMQAAVDNTMSPIIWTAAYNQAIEQTMDEKEAVRFADGVIRQTQGTTLPEDISRFETGPGYARLFTQFVSYFNMMANTNATAMKQIADEVGLRKGAGRLLYVALAGALAPIWVAEAIAQAFRGGPDDKDKDGWLDDWLMAVFGLGTLRGLVAQVPLGGQLAQLVVNRFNDNPADDKFSLSPAVSLLESAGSSPASVYKAIVEDGNKQKAVRDVAAAATLITGLPIYTAARPLGYLAGMAGGNIEPTGPVDLARGLVTGTASPESKQR